MARPRKHASAAARAAAFRQANPTIVASVTPRIADTVEGLAERYEVSKSVVVRSLLRFALTNRDWMKQGLIHLDHTEPSERERLLSAFSSAPVDVRSLELF